MCIRHGLRMLRNPWVNGPSYVTQCPIQPGRSYTYRFRIRDQEGTLWWHAHTGFLRATVREPSSSIPDWVLPIPPLCRSKNFPSFLVHLYNHLRPNSLE
ncbi:hypothetical protein VIGAN_04111800 [Vigna angularis var. angularis]|uniref:Plastocyanin-like domain-containing protein n=1 Tax=Vigna angularis var. angularis TaxID=157739 RepID=A0A0S3RTI7_PHAAN|nr:hypothetical protein VIGAN_04111800 [Vigna angularis var. angularis]